MEFVILIIAAYLLGSIPFGLIIAKFHGVDLRSIGSGNIGATNVSRALGKRWAYFCFLLDALKGFLPVFGAVGLLSESVTTIEMFLWLAVGAAAILGHVFPLYIRFKGGKGVATSFGVAIGVWPYFTICAAIAFVVWLICIFIWRYISLASMIGSASFTVALIIMIAVKDSWDFASLWPLLIAAVAIALMVIILHKDNIKRIIAGTESKVLQGKNV